MTGLSADEVLALPAAVDLVTAARCFGIGRTKAFELLRTNEFPVEVRKLGRTYRCTRTDICEALKIPLTPLTP